MFRRMIALVALVMFALLASAEWPAAAQPHAPPVLIRLRSASFDPLAGGAPARAALQRTAESQLLLVQLRQPPDASTPAILAAAGLRPLAYVPDNAFVVRGAAGAWQHAAWLRWAGPFEAGYKLADDLDTTLRPSQSSVNDAALLAELWLLPTPDGQAAPLQAAVRAAGGSIVGGGSGAEGMPLHVRLPAAAIRSFAQRADVLWMEPFVPLRITNDRANAIMGVPVVRQQLGLDGSGQIVAITDTGLDVQEQLSADFAGRVVRGFVRQDMYSACTIYSNGETWSDTNGHGTHVAGSLLGSGALSPAGQSFAGVAPEASIVVQAVSSGGSDLNCLGDGDGFLALAYAAGARVQNASFGGPTGRSGDEAFGRYTVLSQTVDRFMWQHPEHTLVVSAGNSGSDRDADGVVDADSIEQPASAKNVISVGASESMRPPTDAACAASPPQNVCWKKIYFSHAPLANDFVSDNPNGIAAFSSRGPADDGRIKPEIVAPGTNIISSRSHDPSAVYFSPFDANYAYESGTSMATPMVSGLAALTRQWLAQARGIDTPSAALVKALLLNGAANISPGQYGIGPQREIPASWPNTVEGWGRADIAATVGADDPQQVWLADAKTGLQTGQTISYTLQASAGQPLRVTLAWTDYPALPNNERTLVNDLDLAVQAPDGAVLRGNAAAALPAACRDASGADRCNVAESIEIAAPLAGTYTVLVHAPVVAQGGRQPFALAARAQQIVTAPLPPAPVLRSVGAASGPALALAWSGADGAMFYQLEQQATISDTLATSRILLDVAGQQFTQTVDTGTYQFRVRGCTENGCGPWSNAVELVVDVPPRKTWLPFAAGQ